MVAEVEPGADRARLEPAWAPSAVTQRLDTELGIQGWSFTITAAGGMGVACALTLDQTTRSAVAGSRQAGPSLEQLADLAFARCARQFGIAPPVATEHETYWVDFDPDTGEALYEPEPVPAQRHGETVPAVAEASGFGGALSADAAAPASGRIPAPDGATDEAPEASREAREASSEALAMIERLIDRLKADGLGKEAARLVATHHGATAEQARELYGRLRALLKKEANS